MVERRVSPRGARRQAIRAAEPTQTQQSQPVQQELTQEEIEAEFRNQQIEKIDAFIENRRKAINDNRAVLRNPKASDRSRDRASDNITKFSDEINTISQIKSRIRGGENIAFSDARDFAKDSARNLIERKNIRQDQIVAKRQQEFEQGLAKKEAQKLEGRGFKQAPSGALINVRTGATVKINGRQAATTESIARTAQLQGIRVEERKSIIRKAPAGPPTPVEVAGPPTPTGFQKAEGKVSGVLQSGAFRTVGFASPFSSKSSQRVTQNIQDLSKLETRLQSRVDKVGRTSIEGQLISSLALNPVRTTQQTGNLVLGAQRQVRSQPIESAALVGAGAAVGFATPFAAAGGAALAAKTGGVFAVSQSTATVAGLGVTSVIAARQAQRISAESTPALKAQKLGEIGAETTLIGLGALAGSQAGTATLDRIRTAGREIVPAESIVKKEVLEGKQTFPSERSGRAQVQAFKEQRFVKFDDTVSANPRAFHATNVPRSRFQSPVPDNPVRPSDVPGQFVAPSVSPNFLRQSGRSTTFSFNPTPVGTTPQVFRSELVGLKTTSFTPVDKASQFFRTTADPGVGFVRFGPGETEAVIRPGSEFVTRAGGSAFLFAGRRIPIDEQIFTGALATSATGPTLVAGTATLGTAGTLASSSSVAAFGSSFALSPTTLALLPGPRSTQGTFIQRSRPTITPVSTTTVTQPTLTTQPISPSTPTRTTRSSLISTPSSPPSIITTPEISIPPGSSPPSVTVSPPLSSPVSSPSGTGFAFGGLFQTGKRRRATVRPPKRFVPNLASFIFDIRGKQRTQGTFSGGELRAIPINTKALIPKRFFP